MLVMMVLECSDVVVRGGDIDASHAHGCGGDDSSFDGEVGTGWADQNCYQD